MSKKLHLISLGCTKNLVDSEVMLGCLAQYEHTSLEEADVVIVNTCGFIEAAKQESIQTILNALEYKRDDAILVASGCLSERYAKELKEEIPEIDIIVGVGAYDRIDALIAERKRGGQICQIKEAYFWLTKITSASLVAPRFMLTLSFQRVAIKSAVFARFRVSRENCIQEP